jgi:hypothetical protein
VMSYSPVSKVGVGNVIDNLVRTLHPAYHTSHTFGYVTYITSTGKTDVRILHH